MGFFVLSTILSARCDRVFVFIYFVSVPASKQFCLFLFTKHYRFRTLKLHFVRIFYFSVSRNHFNMSCFFSSDAVWKAGCFFFDISGPHFCTPEAPWETMLAPRNPLGNFFSIREHLGLPFWHLGTNLGTNLGAILAPRDHPGGP